jgi:hypothetical protein
MKKGQMKAKFPLQKIVKIKNFMKFAQIWQKQTLKYTIFVNIKKKTKKGQMTKPFYFWQTVSKKAQCQPCSQPPHLVAADLKRVVASWALCKPTFS